MASTTLAPEEAARATVRRRDRGVLERLGEGSIGPVRLAVVLALASVPFVAVSFLLPPIFEVDDGFTPPNIVHAFIVAAAATVGAAVVAGGIAGLFVRWRPTLGTFLAFALGWPVAVTLVSMTASALQLPFETSYSCFDTCGPMVHAGDPFSGFFAYLISTIVSAFTIVPFVIAVLCLYGAHKLYSNGYPMAGTALLAIGYFALDWLSFLGGAQPIVAYLLLSIGIALWVRALGRHAVLGG